MFFVYQLLLSLIFLISPIIILFRILEGKEDKKRFNEKFAIFSKKRKPGKLIWFHGASVGEILSVIPLIEKYEKDKNLDTIISSIKPPIFWKEKDSVKRQAKTWKLIDLKKKIFEINDLEMLIKNNTGNSLNILSDFIINC